MFTPFMEMPQRAEASLDHHHAALAGGGGGLRGVALHADFAGHDVLADADAGMAVDDDGRLLVHARAVIAGMAVDDHLDRHCEAGGDRVGALGIEHAPGTLVRVRRQLVQPLVEVADRGAGEIDRDHAAFGRFQV
jgi:hypothetical protein